MKLIFKRLIVSCGIVLSFSPTILAQSYVLQPAILTPQTQQATVAQTAPLVRQGMIGLQAGYLNGVFATSRLPSTEVLIAALGIHKSNFAFQLQLNYVYTVEGLSCYTGVSGLLTSGHNPQAGGGIPFGLIYQIVEGPTFFMELGPQIISGTEFEVVVQATARVGIPL